MALHESKPVGERERLGEPYALDLEAGLRGHAARVLEHRRDIPVTALLEHDAGTHCRSLRRYLVTAVRSAACAISAPCCCSSSYRSRNTETPSASSASSIPRRAPTDIRVRMTR